MAQQLILNVEERADRGTSKIRALRKSGFVPGIVYSEGKQGTSISISSYDFGRYVSSASHTQLFKFKSSSKSLDGVIALLKDLQTEPVKQVPLHVDFYSVHEGHKISLTVPLELVGLSPAVKTGAVILNQQIYEIEVECLPTEIPDVLTLDISTLDEGVTFHISDVQLPAGAKLKSDPELAVVTAISRSELEEAPAPVAAAAVEAAPAEGAAAAAGAATDAKKGDAKKPEAKKDDKKK